MDHLPTEARNPASTRLDELTPLELVRLMNAERDLEALGLNAGDVLVGIATSGRTPYVGGALAHARRVGAYAIGLFCNPDSDLLPLPDLAIVPAVGPEVLTGSTRLKAGTATK